MKFIKIFDIRVEKCAKTNKARIAAPSQISAIEKVFVKALENYFKSLTPISRAVVSQLDWSVLSPFQKEVFLETFNVAFGKTITYGELSENLRRRKIKAAPRAVGQALKKNPYPILIPCHRVVGKADLGGYSGNNQNWKIWLLEHEGASF